MCHLVNSYPNANIALIYFMYIWWQVSSSEIQNTLLIETHFKNMFHTSDIGKTDTRPSAGLYSPLISWSMVVQNILVVVNPFSVIKHSQCFEEKIIILCRTHESNNYLKYVQGETNSPTPLVQHCKKHMSQTKHTISWRRTFPSFVNLISPDPDTNL